MGAWYTVIKTIKGYHYTYLQRTRREGRHVRTENRYVGPAAGGGIGAGSSYVGLHGSREGIEAGVSPEPSANGTYGPGFYLTPSERRADLYSRYPSKYAADYDRMGGYVGEPTHDGTVTAFDLSGLKILFIKDSDTYIDLADLVGTDGEPKGYPVPSDKIALQELLEGRGYDGIEVNDPDRMEIVIFPSAVERLRRVTTTSLSDMELDALADEALVKLTCLDWNIIESQYRSPVKTTDDPTNFVQRHEHAEEVIKATKARVMHAHAERMFYRPDRDKIYIPVAEYFKNTLREYATNEYYGSLFHELTHWTGKPSRLNRYSEKANELGNCAEAAAREELVAELSAAILLRYFNVDGDPRCQNSASFFLLWLVRTKDQKKSIAYAKKEAKRAVQYILTMPSVE